MRRRLTVVWLARGALGVIVAEADSHAPNESGGMLLGYWATEYKAAIVTAVVGPGSAAGHRPDGIRPDTGFQEAAIASAYRESDGATTYLGDWHSHPSSPGRVSKRDRVTLRNIAREPAAGAPCPLMLVLFRPDGGWRLAGWQGASACWAAWWCAPPPCASSTPKANGPANEHMPVSSCAFRASRWRKGDSTVLP